MNKHTWQDIDFEIHDVNPGFRVLLPANGTLTLADVESTVAISQEAISSIATLPLDNIPVFNAIILPHDSFIKASDIPDEFKDWADVCGRKVFDPHKNDTSVFSTNHNLRMSHPSGLEQQTDALRETIHEYLHSAGKAFDDYQLHALPFSEALVETIPRLIMGLQTELPQSTEFLNNLTTGDIQPVKDLWTWEDFPPDPLQTNKGYASAFMLGAGLIKAFRIRETPRKKLYCTG